MSTLSFPFEITPSGKTAAVSGVDAIMQQVKMVLTTSLGSRVMSPTYGSPFPATVFESVDKEDVGELEESIRLAVERNVTGAKVAATELLFNDKAGAIEATVYVSREVDAQPRAHTVSLQFGRVFEDNTP